MNSEIRLNIVGLVYNQTVVGTYGLVLAEVEGNRRFSIMIGESEAQSIAMKMNNKKSPRPLTHDLIKNIFTLFGATPQKVLIYDMVNEIFYSEIVLHQENEIKVIRARTSDAVAIAVRCDCPIYIQSEILDIVGTIVESDEQGFSNSMQTDIIEESDLSSLPLDKLEELLHKALKDEDYEKAAKLRDLINAKK